MAVQLTDETRLSDAVLLKGGFPLYCSEYADLYEQHGGSFGAGAEITNYVPDPPEDKLLAILREYEQELADGWGKPPSQVYSEMGLEDDDDVSDALYATLMACRGHGIGLEDDYRDAIKHYESQHGPLDTSPFYDEMNDLNELAWENLERPDGEEWGVFERAGNALFEGKFHSKEYAERWLADTGFNRERHKYKVKKVKRHDR